VFSLVSWSPLALEKGLVAPLWATALGWILTFSSVSLLPIWAVYALATTPGTLPQVTPALSLNSDDMSLSPRDVFQICTRSRRTMWDFFFPPFG